MGELEVSKSCDIESPNKRKGRESTPESKKRRVSLRSHSDLHSSPHEMSTRSKINIDKTPKPSTLGLPSKELYYSGCPDYKQIQKQLAMKSADKDALGFPKDSIVTSNIPYNLPTSDKTGYYNEEIDLGNLQESPEVLTPSWGIHIVQNLYCMEGTENIEDETYLKRHAKHEAAERRRKRW